MKRWFIWILWFCCLLFCCILYPCPSFALLMNVTLIFPVLSYVFTLLGSRFLTWQIVDEDEKARFILTNKGPFHFAKIRIVLRIRHIPSGGLEIRHWDCSLGAGKSRQYLVEDLDLHVGENQIEIKKLSVSDMTGLFFIHSGKKIVFSHMILPEIYPASVQIRNEVWSFWTDSSSYLDQAGNDNTELFDLRDYRPGDRIQQIHWKISTGKRNLIVKEWSQPDVSRILFLVDDMGKPGIRQNDYDRFCSLILSFSMALVQEKCRHDVGWMESIGDYRIIAVDSEEAVYHLQILLAEKISSPSESVIYDLDGDYSPEDHFQAYFPHRQYAAIYGWHLDGSLSLHGETINKWNQSDWHRLLSEKGQVF
ncbi:MAG: DUF58 domain-containing protein [Clostridiales bacterium]|nr:DUF58 domain-containing protein [Clostridiales bacterium]